jgi:hypothetical protein
MFAPNLVLDNPSASPVTNTKTETGQFIVPFDVFAFAFGRSSDLGNVGFCEFHLALISGRDWED